MGNSPSSSPKGTRLALNDTETPSNGPIREKITIVFEDTPALVPRPVSYEVSVLFLQLLCRYFITI